MRMYVVFDLKIADETAFFEWCRAGGETIKVGKRDEKNGTLTCSMPKKGYDRLRRDAPVAVAEKGRVGLLPCLLPLWRRPGILSGLLLALALVIASRFFLWEVRVTESDGLPAEAVTTALEQAGLEPGTFLPRLDVAAAELRLRQAEEHIGYAAVNRHGTVVTVQLRAVKEAQPRAATAPADLVAACDGVVRQVLVFAGECLVGEGDAVRRGQVLVRGIYTAGEEKAPVRQTRAAGVVVAETVKKERIEVPFSYTMRQHTGKKQTRARLLFFNKQLKLFKNTGNYGQDCDIIETENRLTLGGARVLPFGIAKTTVYETKEVPMTRSAEEAVEEARRQWQTAFGEVPGRRLLSLSETVETTKNGIAVTFVAVCEENIAFAAERPSLP